VIYSVFITVMRQLIKSVVFESLLARVFTIFLLIMSRAAVHYVQNVPVQY